MEMFTIPFQAIAAVFLILIILICIYELIIRPLQEDRLLPRTYTGLYGNARRLGLQVCEVKENSMFAAVADQLCVKCPYGNYSAESLKKKISLNVHEESPQSLLSQLRKRYKHSVVQNEWQTDVDKLQDLADAIHRVIEIVHDDRRETTVLRPLDMQINESIMVLYIGRCCRGNYYSLRQKNKEKTGNILDNNTRSTHSQLTYKVDAQLCSVDELKRKNAADKEDAEAEVLSQNNSMIGDNCRQFIINRPGFNSDDTVIQNNTVTGQGSTQNILVTVTESEPLKRYLQNRNFVEEERSNFHLKIRQRSDNMSCEQFEQKELAVIQSLNSVDSEARNNLDTVLDKFDITFDKAMQGCILLVFSANSNSSFIQFADGFNNRGLDKLVNFILRYILIDTDAPTIDLELSVDTESEHGGPESSVVSDSNSTNLADTNCNEQEKLSKGITILCKPKLKGQDNRSRLEADMLDKFPQEVTETVFNSEFAAGLVKSACEENVRFDRYAFDPFSIGSMNDVRQEINQNNHNRLFEAMHGVLGIITTHDGKKGTCFQVGNNYVLSAGHIFYDSDLKDGLLVRFPSEDQKPAQLVYLCEELDFAIVCVNGIVSLNKHLRYYLYPCSPGLPLDLMYPGNDGQCKPTIERATIVSNDYMFSKHENARFVLLEALGELRPGSSGSPGVIYQNGKLYIIAVLIGTLTTSHDAFYVVTSMEDIILHLELIKPELLKELMISYPAVLRKASVG